MDRNSLQNNYVCFRNVIEHLQLIDNDCCGMTNWCLSLVFRSVNHLVYSSWKSMNKSVKQWNLYLSRLHLFLNCFVGRGIANISEQRNMPFKSLYTFTFLSHAFLIIEPASFREKCPMGRETNLSDKSIFLSAKEETLWNKSSEVMQDTEKPIALCVSGFRATFHRFPSVCGTESRCHHEFGNSWLLDW